MFHILEALPTHLPHEEFQERHSYRVVRLLEPSRGASDKQAKHNPRARCFHTGSDGSDFTHARSFTSTILYTKQGGVLMRTHLQSAQHVIPSSLGSITPDMDTLSGH